MLVLQPFIYHRHNFIINRNHHPRELTKNTLHQKSRQTKLSLNSNSHQKTRKLRKRHHFQLGRMASLLFPDPFGTLQPPTLTQSQFRDLVPTSCPGSVPPSFARKTLPRLDSRKMQNTVWKYNSLFTNPKTNE